MSKRSSMLATEVRSVIAPVLKRCPPKCGMVSITRLEISDDSSYATAYISALLEPKAALDFLNGEMRDLQRLLGKMPRRNIPRLRFRIDEGTKHSDRIDELLGEASKERTGDS